MLGWGTLSAFGPGADIPPFSLDWSNRSRCCPRQFVAIFGFVVCFSFVGLQQIGGTMAGLAAAALGPVVVWSLHIRGKYYTEVPLAALVLGAVVAHAASDGFRKRWPSALFGVLLGLGLLTKWSYAFFMGPMATLVIVFAVWGSVQHHKVRPAVAILTGLVPLLIAGGAAGRVPFGLTIGFWLAVILIVGLATIGRKLPDWLTDDGGGRLMHIALCVGLCVAIAGPWYWTYLPNMQGPAANLSQKFHGDPVSGLYGWPFYPSVLLTRMMSTPLLAFFVGGVALGLWPKTPPLIRWSMFSLLCGTLILGVLPYRAGRYLIAGLGLVVPLALWPLIRWKWAAKWSLPCVFAFGMAHQTSWIPLAVDGLRIPHHWPILTLPAPDLMGNTKRGIYQAYLDLLRPRWRFLPLANPPIHKEPMAQRVARQVTQDADQTPSFAVVVDRAGGLNLNAMRTHQHAMRPLPTTRIVESNAVIDTETLTSWRVRARKPRDQPATADGPAQPRQLFVVLTYPPPKDLRKIQCGSCVRRDLNQWVGMVFFQALSPWGVTVWKAR